MPPRWQRWRVSRVITSYSIHYTKLYEECVCAGNDAVVALFIEADSNRNLARMLRGERGERLFEIAMALAVHDNLRTHSDDGGRRFDQEIDALLPDQTAYDGEEP